MRRVRQVIARMLQEEAPSTALLWIGAVFGEVPLSELSHLQAPQLERLRALRALQQLLSWRPSPESLACVTLPEKGAHHPSWEGHKRFFFYELSRQGWTYEQACAFGAFFGRGRPSTWSREDRTLFLEALPAYPEDPPETTSPGEVWKKAPSELTAHYRRVLSPEEETALLWRDTSDPVRYLPGTWRVDPRGGLLEVLRSEEVGPIEQVYVSATGPDVVKAWHLHLRQHDRFSSLPNGGRFLVATLDLRPFLRDPSSEVRGEVEVWTLDPRHPGVLVIPPGVAHGWILLEGDSRGGGGLILNAPSQGYDGSDEWRRAPGEGPFPEREFLWRGRRDG